MWRSWLLGTCSTRFARQATLGLVALIGLSATTIAREPACTTAAEIQQLRTELALTRLQADLLRERSATRVLESWCSHYRLADPATVRAEVLTAATKAPSAETLNRLQVTKAEEVAYRRVALRCGNTTLSEADNWYVPARLTKAMNLRLASSDVPFGKIIAELKPFRVTIAAQPLWSAMSDDSVCQVKPTEASVAPEAVLRVQALLYREDLKPFSEVHEVYQRALITAAGQCANSP